MYELGLTFAKCSKMQ